MPVEPFLRPSGHRTLIVRDMTPPAVAPTTYSVVGIVRCDAALHVVTVRDRPRRLPETQEGCFRAMRIEIGGVRYYSTAAVLAEAGVSRQTLWRWRREGRIPEGHRFRNGQLLFTQNEYRGILAYANRVEPEALSAGTAPASIELSEASHR